MRVARRGSKRARKTAIHINAYESQQVWQYVFANILSTVQLSIKVPHLRTCWATRENDKDVGKTYLLTVLIAARSPVTKLVLPKDQEMIVEHLK